MTSKDQNQTNSRTGQKPLQKNNPIDDQKISRRQFFFIIIQTQIGVGVLSVPFELHSAARQDGWISLIIGASALPVVLLAIWGTARNFPEDSLYRINEKIFLTWGGRVLSAGFVLYFISVGTLIIILYSRMISLWVLPHTPLWITASLMILVCFYMISGGLLVMGRLYTMLSVLILILFGVILYSAKEMNIVYLFPILESGWGRVLGAVNQAFFSFFGYIVSLVIYSKVLGTHKEKLKVILYAHSFVFLFYFIIVFVSFTYFSTEEITLVPEPILYMLKAFELPIIARLDLFFISIWVVNVATTFGTYLYMAGLGLSHLCPICTKTTAGIIVGIIVLALTLYVGYDIQKTEQLNQLVLRMGYAFSLGIPLIMLPLSYVRKKRYKEGE
ncbi:endospore germination permease [Halobacillus kuroshimensis]|uniref:Endospore germination permease n=1 Tax=Halobacillus kuroshimensis TaxID=302481 RepID=A0ABS3E0X0_9BACI|nr:endospore germination permease [Halobacillus sp. Cin3]MBN8237258.1 endospore germination permease [Halobacillus kuroshimensis]